jgi:hypothetical protein
MIYHLQDISFDRWSHLHAASLWRWNIHYKSFQLTSHGQRRTLPLPHVIPSNELHHYLGCGVEVPLPKSSEDHESTIRGSVDDSFRCIGFVDGRIRHSLTAGREGGDLLQKSITDDGNGSFTTRHSYRSGLHVTIL